MTKLWLDTEFNGFGGDFISAALVSENNGHWYQAVACPKPDHWVAQNVVPVLNIRTVSLSILQKSLSKFLSKFNEVTIVADWPVDIEHFCRLLSLRPLDGRIMGTPPLKFELKTWLNCGSKSAIPHNALEDARALMLCDLSYA